jgi:hypothetical protein
VWKLLDQKTAPIRQVVPGINIALGYAQRWFLAVPLQQRPQ